MIKFQNYEDLRSIDKNHYRAANVNRRLPSFQCKAHYLYRRRGNFVCQSAKFLTHLSAQISDNVPIRRNYSLVLQKRLFQQ